MQSSPTPKNPVSDTVASILRLEADAIQRAASRIEPVNIERATNLILECQGKVVVLGVGKSGVIAQKIAQTLTSTGTPSLFLHPSDALHGGLGLLSEVDVVIALSNSGETDEMLALFPALKRRSAAVIAIVGNMSSTMATRSDIVIDASVDQEACPLNLAPTASTTVALAIGDAIAMAVMEARGLTPNEFAANHPGGRLGKRLNISVGDLMHPSPDISPDAGWLEVVKEISNHSLGAVNVVEKDGRLLGIVTDGDLRRTIERTDPEKLSDLKASQMMTAKPVTVGTDMLAFDALRLMEDRPSQISVLPVVDDGNKCLGLLRLHDVVKAGI